jgi:hypothetical protein
MDDVVKDTIQREINNLLNGIGWLDEDRSKALRKVATLDEQIAEAKEKVRILEDHLNDN